MLELRQWLTAPHPSLFSRLARAVLRIFSFPYALAMALRNLAYDRQWLQVRSLQIPVFCIGNLTVGGTGKTPLVAWLCQLLRSLGYRVAIVSRGYGELESGSNDEALELELRLPDVPHIQNADRYAAGLLAQDELDMQVVVLDDGFQHRRLARNLDIVVIDSTDPPAAHWLLPGGLMRESWSALRRAHIVLLTRTQLASEQNLQRIESRVRRYAPEALLVHSRHRCSSFHSMCGVNLELDHWKGKRVLAFCGIGNPPPFFEMLEKAGLQIQSSRTWPDHHAYDAADVAQLQDWCNEQNECDAIVCTMKDWVKLQVPKLGPLPLLALQIEVDISPEDSSKIKMRVEEIVQRAFESV